MKACTRCGGTKPLVEFHRDRGKSEGRSSQCKTCASTRASTWHAANRERRAARDKTYREANLDRVAARKRVWRQANPDLALAGSLRPYGLTPGRYAELLAAQGGGCAICGSPDPGLSHAKRLAVDHNHSCCPGGGSCGRCVRGLLCVPCNTILGQAGDNPDRLLAAAAYLLRSRSVLGETASG